MAEGGGFDWKSLTECAICLNDFTDPKQLSCLHSFCLLCLKNIHEVNQAARATHILLCPLCKTPNNLGLDGVVGLPNDFKTKLLVENASSLPHPISPSPKPATKGQTQCDSCDGTDNVTMQCEDCNHINLCTQCAEQHTKVKVFESHRVVSKQQIKCQNHDKMAEYFCQQCSRVVCHRCITSSHADHKIARVESQFDTFKEMHKTALQSDLDVAVKLSASGLWELQKEWDAKITELQLELGGIKKTADVYFDRSYTQINSYNKWTERLKEAEDRLRSIDESDSLPVYLSQSAEALEKLQQLQNNVPSRKPVGNFRQLYDLKAKIVALTKGASESAALVEQLQHHKPEALGEESNDAHNDDFRNFEYTAAARRRNNENCRTQ